MAFGQRTLPRRAMLSFLCVGAALPILAACGGGSAQSPSSTSAGQAAPTTAAGAAPTSATAPTTGAASATASVATAAPAKPVVAGSVALKALYWSDSPEQHQVHASAFKGFEDKNPGITVEYDDTPSDQFVQKATTMIAGGQPPDCFKLHPSWVLNFIIAKQLTDVSDMMRNVKNAYIPAQLEFWTYQGKQYGVPYYSGPSFIFYNKTLFQKHGAKTPDDHLQAGTWTWQTLRDLATQVTGGTGGDRTFGWDAALDATNLQFYTSVPIWDNQGELVNKDETAWLLDSDPVVSVMQWHADMYLKEKTIPLPADIQGTSWLFRTGKLGMAWAGKFRSLELVNATFDVGQIGTPKGSTGPVNRDGPNASGIPVGTKHLPEAYKLAEFMGSADAAPFLLASGLSVPVRQDLVDSPEFKKGLKPYEKADVYAQSIATVRAWRVPGKGAEAIRALKAEWDKVLVGQQDVPTAMKAAKAAMDPLLKVK